MLITGFMIYTGINLKSILEPTKTKYCVAISPVGYIVHCHYDSIQKYIQQKYDKDLIKYPSHIYIQEPNHNAFVYTFIHVLGVLLYNSYALLL